MLRSDSVRSDGICLVSLSGNSDHHNALYSMFKALRGRCKVATVGAENPTSSNACHTADNHYVACPDRPGIAKGTFDFAAIENVVKVIKSTGCRIVYFESVHLWNCFILMRLGKDYVRVTTLHDVVPHDGSKSVLLCQKLQCRLSDYVVIKSAEFTNDARRLYNLPSERLLTLGVWRDWPTCDFRVGDGSFLFFGRMRKYKGLSTMKRIIDSCPHAHFTVMGAPDKESKPLLDDLQGLPNTEVVGREVNDCEMRNAFQNASWVLLPYESASQSGVIIDAYKYGKPVVAFDVGAVSSQVKDGVTGFLVPAGDISAFVDAVEKAASMDEAAYAAFSHAAYEFGSERYSAEELCEDFARQLNIMLADKGGFDGAI